jgi:hypothetical protein
MPAGSAKRRLQQKPLAVSSMPGTAAIVLSTEAEIIAECEASGRPFEDPHFPPVAESLGCNLTARWLRPNDVFGSPLFPEHGGGCAHVSLGAARLGNKYLLGALAAVSARPALVQRLFVSTRGAAWGVYTLQLWRHGEWVQVMVDSSLPCDPETSAALFARPRPEDGFWLALVEKAAAKLAGSYAALAGDRAPALAGSPVHAAQPAPTFLDALRDLTGGIPVAFPARQMSWDRLMALVESGAPAALTRRGADASAVGAAGQGGGLLRGLPYPLIRINAQRRLVCLGSPWTDPRAPHGPPGSADVPTSGGCFWLGFDQLPMHFDEMLAAEAPHDPTASDARDGRRRRLFAEGTWPAAGSARVAAFELTLSVPMRVTAVLSQRASLACAILLIPASDPAALDVVAARVPLPARLIVRHSLPPRAQRDVVLQSEEALRPGRFYLLAYCMPGTALAVPFCLQLEAECRRGGGGELGSGAEGGGVHEAWAESAALSQLSLCAMRQDQLPPAGGALSISGDAALEALLRQAAPASPPPEDESAVGAMLAALAAAPVRAASASRIQATVRGRRERREMEEMRSLLGARADAAAAVLQAAARGAPARREGADARRSVTLLQAAARGRAARRTSVALAREAQETSELSELRRLGLFLSDQACKVQKVARGNSARRLACGSRSESALPSGRCTPRDASVQARLDRIEELLLRLSGGGTLPRMEAPSDGQREAAARTLQAHARGRGGRLRAAGERERLVRDGNALRIQAAVRGAGGRRTAREMRRRVVGAEFFAVQPFDRYASMLLSEGGAGDEWRYVPRHAAKAAAAAAAQRGIGLLPVDVTLAASRLQSFGLGAPGAREADLHPVGYRSRVLELQRRQRMVVAGLPLGKPERVARLLVEKDAALERLAEMHAAGAPVRDVIVTQRTVREEVQRAFALQRGEYHAAMRELSAELARQVRQTRRGPCNLRGCGGA